MAERGLRGSGGGGLGGDSAEEEITLPDYLTAALQADYADDIFKYLAPPAIGHVELSLKRDLVFPATGTPLLQKAAGRMNVVVGRGAAGGREISRTELVRLGEGRVLERRVAWAIEFLKIHLAKARRRRAGRKSKLVAAGEVHSLVVSGEEGKVCSFGCGGQGRLGHGGGE